MNLFALQQRCFPDEPCHYGEFIRLIKSQALPSRCILDLGCGDNRIFTDLRRTGCTVWGTDFHQHPNLGYPDYFRLLLPEGTLPFEDASFDLVSCMWVLEHVQRPAFFLREVRRVLRPGGLFVGHSIHGLHYVTWIRRLFQLVPHSWTQKLVRRLYGRAEHDTFPTCYRMNTAGTLRSLARRAGMDYLLLRRYADQGYFGFHPWAKAGAVLADWFMEKLFGCGRLYFTVQLQRPLLASSNRPFYRQAG